MDLQRYHRLIGPLYRLEGDRVSSVRCQVFPVETSVPPVRRSRLEGVSLKRTGILLSYTEVFNIPESFGRESYLLRFVRLDDGVNLVAQLANFPASKLKPGQRVKMVIRKILEDGESVPIVYGYKFQAE